MKLETILNAYGKVSHFHGIFDTFVHWNQRKERLVRQENKFKERLLKTIRVYDTMKIVAPECKFEIHVGTLCNGGVHDMGVVYVATCECEHPLLSGKYTIPTCQICGKQISGFEKTSQGE